MKIGIKSFKIFVLIAGWFFSLGVAQASGDPKDRASYKSYLQFPMEYYNSNTWAVLGQKEAFPPENFTGKTELHYFRKVWSCSSSTAAVNGVRCSYPDSELKLIKFFVPPSFSVRQNFAVTVYHGQPNGVPGNRFVAVARFGEPPQGDYDPNQLQYDETLPTQGATWQQVNGQDYVSRGTGGITLVVGAWVEPGFTGGWLYVRLFEFSAEMNHVDFSVNYSSPGDYEQWYQKMNWGADGDPTDPYIIQPPFPTFTPTPTKNPTPSPTFRKSDFDQDGDVDIDDFNIFHGNYGKKESGNPADLDQDGDVDIDDFNIFHGEYGD